MRDTHAHAHTHAHTHTNWSPRQKSCAGLKRKYYDLMIRYHPDKTNGESEGVCEGEGDSGVGMRVSVRLGVGAVSNTMRQNRGPHDCLVPVPSVCARPMGIIINQGYELLQKHKSCAKTKRKPR